MHDPQASANLVPPKYRAITGWIVGWLNLLGQCAGVASTEYGLARMICAYKRSRPSVRIWPRLI